MIQLKLLQKCKLDEIVQGGYMKKYMKKNHSNNILYT